MTNDILTPKEIGVYRDQTKRAAADASAAWEKHGGVALNPRLARQKAAVDRQLAIEEVQMRIRALDDDLGKEWWRIEAALEDLEEETHDSHVRLWRWIESCMAIKWE